MIKCILLLLLLLNYKVFLLLGFHYIMCYSSPSILAVAIETIMHFDPARNPIHKQCSLK